MYAWFPKVASVYNKIVLCFENDKTHFLYNCSVQFILINCFITAYKRSVNTFSMFIAHRVSLFWLTRTNKLIISQDTDFFYFYYYTNMSLIHKDLYSCLVLHDNLHWSIKSNCSIKNQMICNEQSNVNCTVRNLTTGFCHF